jgi:enoyl-CoA hydratase
MEVLRMDFENVKLKVGNGIGWITINRPEKLNALNDAVLKDLETALDRCKDDPEVEVLVIKGHPKAFIAGADIKQMSEGGTPIAIKVSDQTMVVQEKLAGFNKPTIAAIAGYALGGGCELALCCDFRIAADNAKLGLPEINLGIIPGGGGTQRLPRLIGLGPAIEMILLGEVIDAGKAEQLGLVNNVTPAKNLENEVMALASKLMTKPPWALRAAKTAIHAGMDCGLKEGLKMEQALFAMLFGTEDKDEGMRAFLEKRDAKFVGR